MTIIDWRLETGFVGDNIKGEVEVEDDASEDEIYEAVTNDMWNYVNLIWDKRAF